MQNDKLILDDPDLKLCVFWNDDINYGVIALVSPPERFDPPETFTIFNCFDRKDDFDHYRELTKSEIEILKKRAPSD